MFPQSNSSTNSHSFVKRKKVIVLSMPCVSVLMPIKGDCPFLPFAIESVRVQSLADWELIISQDFIDDASSRYLADVIKMDTRVKIIDSCGLTLPSALNKGLNECGGEFIARFDADDIMFPWRLSSQILFLQENPDYVACGGQIVIIDEYQKMAIASPYYNLKNRTLKGKIEFKCPFPHPGTTIRARALREVKGYSAHYKFAEDYELWMRLASLGKFANLKRPVIAYRSYTSQTSARFRTETRLHMAYALLGNCIGGDRRINLESREVTKELFQSQYLLLDKSKQAVIDRYYGNESFLSELFCGPIVDGQKESFKNDFFAVVSSSYKSLVHFILRLLVSINTLIVIRPLWQRYLTKLNSAPPPRM